ncbi:MAG: molybdenum cofactor biosynthesis protein MoaE [Magnetococcales bacterium]|nr:molybdenum cofactor biosynthesis protein MoaE [Magnetococcales bacterium]
MIRIQENDFSLEEEIGQLTQNRGRIGGVVSFLGKVRDFSDGESIEALDIEHYPGMTEKELERIEEAARAKFEVEELLVVHRVGRLQPCDNIVLVVAACSHRASAFDACRFVIDHLKLRATFWKRETTSKGSRWVDVCPGCQAAANPLHGSAPTHTHHHHAKQETPGWNGLDVGLLTLSDSRTLADDGSGDALEGLLSAAGAVVKIRHLLPDDQAAIAACLTDWADRLRLDCIVTTGGTGPGPRDCTPEATRQVCGKELPGLAEEIRRAGLAQVRSALLTRGVAALRGRTLVINLPGSRRGAVHSLQAIADLVPHILRMVHGGGHS